MSRNLRTALVVGFVGVIASFWWWGGPRDRWLVSREVPPRPWTATEDVSLAAAVAEAEARAEAGEREGLEELVRLYHANVFGQEAAGIYRGLHALEPENMVWQYYADRPPTDWNEAPDVLPSAVREWQLKLPASVFGSTFAERRAAELSPRDPELAQQWMLRAIELAPEEGRLYFRSAVLWEQLREQVKAKDAYERAVEVDPQLAEAWARLITLYRAIGDTGGVVGALREGLATSPDSPVLLLERGRSAKQRGRFDDALRDFSRVIEIEPAVVPAWVEAAQIHFARDEVKAGTVLLERFLAVSPENPIALVMLAFAAITQEERSDADRWLARVAQQPLVPERDRARLWASYRQVFGVNFEAVP